MLAAPALPHIASPRLAWLPTTPPRPTRLRIVTSLAFPTRFQVSCTSVSQYIYNLLYMSPSIPLHLSKINHKAGLKDVAGFGHDGAGIGVVTAVAMVGLLLFGGDCCCECGL